MSSISFMITAEEMLSLRTTINCNIAVLIILVYDWLLCLDQESALIWNWKTRQTVAPLVYVLARYMSIVENAFIVISVFPMSLLSCEVNRWFQVISGSLSLFAPAVFSAMRTYALSGTNVYLAFPSFILSIAPIITDLIERFKFESIQILPSPFNCSAVDRIPQQLENNLIIIARTCLISADLLVVIVTWMYTYQSYKIQKSLKFGPSLGSVMLYDGSLYFVVLASLNVLQMVLTALQIDETIVESNSFVVTFLDPISSILICHFLLNLRQVDRKTANPSLPSNQDGDVTIQFATQHATLPTFIGSFGEPVHTGSAVDPDIDLEGESPGLVQNESSEANGEIVEVDRV